MAETQLQTRGFGWMYALMGVIAVFGGIYSLNSRVKGIAPYLFSLDPTPYGETEQDNRLQELASLQKQDSDGDTLSDFDEQYVYYTSSYLADTDSDGKADNVEVEAKTDPTCAEGQVCNQIRALTQNPTTDEVATTAAGSKLDVLQGDDINPESVKAELQKMGIPEYTFANISDEDLVEVYKSVANQYPTDTDTTTQLEYDPDANVSVEEISASQTTDSYDDLVYDTTQATEGSFAGFTSLEDFKKLDVSQVRSLLLQSGVSGEELNAMTDEELMAIYTETLKQQLNEATPEE